MLNSVAAFLTTFSLVLSAGPAGSSDKQTTTVKKVEEKDSGTSVSLHVGDRLEVTLEGNPSTGYTWQKISGGERVLKQVGQPESRSSDTNKRIIGAPVKMCFRFEAIDRGNTKLQLAYLRPWEKDVKPAKTFEVTVDVK